ncbi:MAG: universal stress protein, partial [Saprospiraceae bacterium]|nr:universal stress protein [Saprospiraceae bacterium]
MIQLVSPTDFSDVSENALKYAIGLQRVFGEELAIVHFYQRVRATGHFISMRDILQEDSEREMQQLVKSLEGSLPEKKQIRLKVAEGEVPEMLRGMVKGDRLHLIVMGSNGASKIKNIFGSTAKAVINQVLTPTLIIPPGCEYKKYEHMVVA